MLLFWNKNVPLKSWLFLTFSGKMFNKQVPWTASYLTIYLLMKHFTCRLHATFHSSFVFRIYFWRVIKRTNPETNEKNLGFRKTCWSLRLQTGLNKVRCLFIKYSNNTVLHSLHRQVKTYEVFQCKKLAEIFGEVTFFLKWSYHLRIRRFLSSESVFYFSSLE